MFISNDQPPGTVAEVRGDSQVSSAALQYNHSQIFTHLPQSRIYGGSSEGNKMTSLCEFLLGWDSRPPVAHNYVECVTWTSAFHTTLDGNLKKKGNIFTPDLQLQEQILQEGGKKKEHLGS